MAITIKFQSNDEWIQLESEEDLLYHYPAHVWGTYRPQPWTKPSRYPCLMREMAIMNNSSGSDHAMLIYLYDFEIIDDVNQPPEGSV